MDSFENRMNELTAELNTVACANKTPGEYYTPSIHFIHWSDKGRKFAYIDIGTSGAWLVEKTTGEIFNIKAYGVPDRNKKMKSDIGNIATVDPKIMYAKRWNYLR